MRHFRISVDAEQDIDEIVAYTNSTWGWRQTDQYLAKLEDGFDLLAHNSSIGRPCESIFTGLRRFEVGRQVVFYLPEPDGVLIVGVLHQQMLPDKYL